MSSSSLAETSPSILKILFPVLPLKPPVKAPPPINTPAAVGARGNNGTAASPKTNVFVALADFSSEPINSFPDNKLSRADFASVPFD